MKIFPAIDLRDGKVVRLFQGDYDQMTIFSDDPVGLCYIFAPVCHYRFSSEIFQRSCEGKQVPYSVIYYRYHLQHSFCRRYLIRVFVLDRACLSERAPHSLEYSFYYVM